jgi:rubrerythrin
MRQLKTVILVAGLAATSLGSGVASAQPPYSPAGREALKTAMFNEAFTMAQYKLYAEQAKRSGNRRLAELMSVASNMEYGHFLRWAELYKLVGSDEANLRSLASDEINNDVALYQRLASEAAARGEKDLSQQFDQVKGQEAREQDEFMKAVEQASKSN